MSTVLVLRKKGGPYNSVWTLNKRGNVPAMNNFNPAYPKGIQDI